MAHAPGHVYLSPHFDDAVLSCGGTIRRQVRAGEAVRVLTVCGGVPPRGEGSALARSFHAMWGESGEVVAMRREEDRAALAILGAEAYALDFPEAIYRGGPAGWRYATREVLFGPVHEADRRLVGEVADAIAAVIGDDRGAVVYAPLGVGGHVDHRIVHAAAVVRWSRGWPVVFYEDFPYVRKITVGRQHALAPTLAGVEVRWRFRLQGLTEADLAAKIEGVRAYASQVRMLFHDESTLAQRVRDYARRVGAGGWAERFWIAQ